MPAALHRYDRQGVLALQPQAFLDLFVEVTDQETNEQLAGATVVHIRGPLDHHAGWWCDSYEAILERVTVACRAAAPVVLLRIDSPGGQLAGCLDAARSIRARCAAAGKRVVAYVDGCACSAGYALASAAERIYASDTAFVGSIGVLISRVDVSARDAAEGLRFALVASGKRKIDGNAHAALSEDELAAMQRECESLAALFFEAVAMLRPGLTVDALRQLEAGVFHGAAALSAGLVDELCGFDELLARLAQGGGAMPPVDDQEQQEERTAGPLDDARTALEQAAEGEGEEAERARRALEVLNGEASGDEDDEEEAPAAAAARPPARAARAGAPGSVSASSATALATTVQSLAADVAALKAEKENLERQTMLAARPDLSKELVAKLSTMPVADAREIIDGIPRPDAPRHAATAVVGATRGAGQGTAPALSPDELAMDRAMGIAPDDGGVKRTAHSMEFSVAARPRAVPRAAAPAAGKAGK